MSEKVLADRSAVITGASQGLGRVIARRFVEAGAGVLLVARSAGLLEELAAELRPLAAAGQSVATLDLDVAKDEAPAQVVAAARRLSPGCAVLVNNAGVYGPMGPVETQDWAAWEQALRVNLFAPVRLVQACVPLFRERGQTWADAAELMDYLFRESPVMDEKASKKFLVAPKADLLDEVASLFAEAPDFAPAALESAFNAFIAGKGLELKDVAQPVRVALTGRTASPGLFDVAALVGRDTAVARLRAAAQIARASAG